MTRSTRFRTSAAALAIVAAAWTTEHGRAASPKFLADDPIWVEPDTQDASGMKRLEPDLFVEFAYDVITGRGTFPSVKAGNVNTIDEVPDSSWFTNRAGHQPLTPADVAKGPNTSSGPASGPWTVTSSKSDGVTPGFTVKDATGQRWFLKFDPPGFRAMSTGTEVAATKLMWALGYNVPENYIAYFRREQLVVGSGARFTPAGGRERTMRDGDINQLLKRADREADGSYRVVASKALEGKPIGRIRFLDTRSDDPNDLVPHEQRRELRGYGTFAAWLNHVDAKGINSLDTLVARPDGTAFVRHHLIDFGSSLGSGALEPAEFWSGSHYLVDLGSTGRQMIGFGFIQPRWQHQPFFESRSIGRFAADNTAFDPDAWRPREPNHAFLRARRDDKFWAAQKLAALTTDLIRAAVKSGDFGDPRSEEFLVGALAERRTAIVRAYLTAINPITDPALSAGGMLTFRNAAVDADVARAAEEYHASWFSFDNTTGDTTVLGETIGVTTTLQAPRALPPANGAFIKVALRAKSADHSSWNSPVDAYFQRTNDAWRLVGFERMPDVPLRATTTN